MKPRPTPTLLLILACATLFFFLNSSDSTAQGPQVQVTTADPPSAEQGTINLNVRVTGKGFKNGAKAKWFITGTTNPGGVTVNSTTFVSSSEVSANITVADDAVIANFDIQVSNPDGRGGKGTELFAVVSNAASQNTCVSLPQPSELTYLGGLNDGTRFTNGLGNALSVKRMMLGTTDVLVVAAAQNGNGSGTAEIYFVDPNTGALLDDTNIGSITSVQPHLSPYVGVAIRSMSGGDVNADGIPDFVLGSPNGAAFALVGTVSNGVLSYQVFPLAAPNNTSAVGASVAMGDLDGIAGDEIAVGATGSTTGGNKVTGKALIFGFNGLAFTNTQSIASPIPNPKNDEMFGSAVAIANVTGTSANDLVVGASASVVSGVVGAGRIVVFPGPVNAANYQTLTTGIKNDRLGSSVVVGNVNGGFSDVIGATSDTAATPRAIVFTGPTSSGASPSFVLQTLSGLTGLWAVRDTGDLNGDGLDEVLAGACTDCGGTAYLYLSNPSGPSPLTTRLAFQTLVSSGVPRFGWSAAIGPNSRLIFIGDNLTTVGSTYQWNGQIYVFKLN